MGRTYIGVGGSSTFRLFSERSRFPPCGSVLGSVGGVTVLLLPPSSPDPPGHTESPVRDFVGSPSPGSGRP